MRVAKLLAAAGLLLLASTAVRASLASGSAQPSQHARCNGYECDFDRLPTKVPATDAGCPSGYYLQRHYDLELEHDHEGDDSGLQSTGQSASRKLQATDQGYQSSLWERRQYHSDADHSRQQDYGEQSHEHVHKSGPSRDELKHDNSPDDDIAGYYPYPRHMCVRCDAGTFSPGGMDESCTACGEHQTSPPGSRSRESCSCIDGFGLDNQGGCSVCPIGSFWWNPDLHHGDRDEDYMEGDNNDIEVQPPVRPVSKGLQPCITCDQALGGNATTLRAGACSVKECVCNPGAGGHHCHICPAGYYSQGGDEDQPRPHCRKCSYNAIGKPGAIDIHDCGGCMPGFGGDDCKICPPNTYSTGGTYEPCQACGDNQVSPPGSPSSNFCQCKAGTGLVVAPALGGVVTKQQAGCSACPLGTFWGGPPQAGPSSEQQQHRQGRWRHHHDNDHDDDAHHDDNYYGHNDRHRHNGNYGEDHDHIHDDGEDYYDDYEDHWQPPHPDSENPPGPQLCISCATIFPNGQSTTLFPGSLDGTSCVCSPGYGGLSCEMCPIGTYSTGGDATDRQRECKACPQNTIGSAAPGATSLWACGGCVAGFGGRDCQPCPRNTYSTGGTYDACQPCGPNAISPPQSPSADYCECSSGYGWDGAACTLCPKGTFSAIPPWAVEPQQSVTVTLSSIDATTTTSPAKTPEARVKQVLSCIKCSDAILPGAPARSQAIANQLTDAFTTLSPGSASVKDCVCQPGFGSAFCLPCLSSTYSPGGSTADCRTCPSGINSVTLGLPDMPGIDPTQCACAPGFGLTEKSDQCTVCQPGSYSTGLTLAPCALCPIGMSSALGAQSIDDCFCNVPGWGIIPGESDYCRPCPVGYYSAQVRGKRVCVQCDEGYTTLQPKSGDVTACVCGAGYGRMGAGGGCEKCISPFYQGSLNGFGVPVTGATSANPLPACLLCSGTTPVDGNPPIQVTGSINKVCTAGTDLPSAYCSVAEITAQGAPISFTEPVKTPGCGPAPIFRMFEFKGNAVQKFVLPKGIISMTAELAGASGAAGVRCSNGVCSETTAGGLGGKLTVKNLQSAFKGGEELYIIVGGAAPAATAAKTAVNQSVAGTGGGFTALLSSANPSAASTVWYAVAGGGGGGSGATCVPGGVCLGSAGEGGCASDLIAVNSGSVVGQSPAKQNGRLDGADFMGQKGDAAIDVAKTGPAKSNATQVVTPAPTKIAHGGHGGSCMVGVSTQKVQSLVLAGANAGNGYVKLTIVAAK